MVLWVVYGDIGGLDMGVGRFHGLVYCIRVMLCVT